MRHGFIGFGNLGQAIYIGLKSNKKNNFIYFANSKKDFENIEFSETLEDLIKKSDYIWLCVKPKNVKEVFREIKKIADYRKILRNKIFISVVAGLKINNVQKELFKELQVVRLMPNIQIQNKQSITGFYSTINNPNTNNLKKELLKVGLLMEIAEEYFDTFTALFGSGTAFILEILNSIYNLKNKFKSKIDEKIFLRLFQNTINNLENLDSIPEIVGKITSKGGTTEAGLKYFKKKKLNKHIQQIFLEAEKKSKKM